MMSLSRHQLANSFGGFIKYSLDRQFDNRFFDSSGGFVTYNLDDLLNDLCDDDLN